MSRPIELLSPAGNMDKLKMAIRYGADAVYCAGQAFGLRAGSANFNNEELKEAVEFVHAHGKKIYVTCNIIPHNEDLVGLEEYLQYLESIHVDAIIVADLGIFLLAKRVAPGLELHVSTQANTTNYLTTEFWKEQGATRVVVAREVSIKDIKTMRESADIEIEAFIHGAMCISYSGRCLLSNYFTTTRDANRGQCAQACRWKYSLVESNRPGEYYPIEEDQHGTYIFNSKDLCLLKHIPELYEAGVDSLKIEGRMKSVHYVATVTKVYREAIDTYLKEGKEWYVRDEWMEELEKISHRPYTEGFSVEKPDETAQNYGKSSNTQTHDFIGLVEGYNAEEGFAYMEQRNNFKVGDEVEFCQPHGALVHHVITKMTDENGEEITVAPHPQMKVRLYIDTPLETYSMMRRKCKNQ
ncbi:peptidase U32 family protein [Veillonella magna]|uniref:U32 family peptidase n=1 Tax=Veillonella magna TaxID=464322 RepID=A0ABS2GFY3_9FIRM|nr:U32 family peptidase [Veillonella magna]MBM6823771.1 U32 family peptidase [Veillonella magna]MBM6912250.1 U32 family peptidase [Veillonella magna]